MNLKLTTLLLVTVLSQSLILHTHGARILAAVFMSSKSHRITYNRLLEELAARGHQLTVLSPIISKKNVTNMREILTYDSDLALEKMPNLFEMKVKNEKLNMFNLLDFCQDLCVNSYKLPQVMDLLKEEFDLIITQPFMNECMAGYLHKFNTSVILITPLSAPANIVEYLGGPAPSSFTPNMMAGYGEKMNFYERLGNMGMNLFMTAIQKFYYIPTMEKIYREALGDPTLPSYAEFMKNVSLILSNSHFSMGGRRPFMPDVIEVGGMHCHPANPLPKALEDFAQSSGPEGFIYFSMGSALKGSTMPSKYRDILLSAFAKLKQKVLWKWETETMDNLPANVKLIKWAPQQDILGHPKLRAFITHGGLGSTTEAVYHGVPLVGIPMFADQLMNMEKSVKSGYAYALEFTELTEAKILEAINTVVGDPKYKENAQTLSKIFRDQPSQPLDRAVFWTEYVLRHKGAVHLRSAARDLNFIQYHSLDVIAVVFVTLFTVLYIAYAIVKCTARAVCGARNSKKVPIRSKNTKKNK